MAPWVFASVAISFTILPAQVAHATAGYSIAFAGVVAGLTLGVGVAIQPVARRLDARPASPSAGLGCQVGLAAVVGGLLVSAGAAQLHQPVLVLVAAALLGAGYGTSLVSGLLEVQRVASAHHLAGLTAAFYALTYIGFAAPVVLAAIAGTDVAGYPALLVAAAALCALTLVAVSLGDRRARRARAMQVPAG